MSIRSRKIKAFHINFKLLLISFQTIWDIPRSWDQDLHILEHLNALDRFFFLATQSNTVWTISTKLWCLWVQIWFIVLLFVMGSIACTNAWAKSTERNKLIANQPFHHSDFVTKWGFGQDGSGDSKIFWWSRFSANQQHLVRSQFVRGQFVAVTYHGPWLQSTDFNKQIVSIFLYHGKE